MGECGHWADAPLHWQESVDMVWALCCLPLEVSCTWLSVVFLQKDLVELSGENNFFGLLCSPCAPKLLINGCILLLFKWIFLFNTFSFPSWGVLCLHVPPQITKQQLQQTKDRFQAFLNGDTQIVADEAFINAVQSYNEVPPHNHHFVIRGQELNASRSISEYVVLSLHTSFIS